MHNVLFNLFISLCLYETQQVFGPECRDPIYIPVDENVKNAFLNSHNRLRNQQALGENDNILKPQVADMATMVSQVELLSCLAFVYLSFDHLSSYSNGMTNWN